MIRPGPRLMAAIGVAFVFIVTASAPMSSVFIGRTVFVVVAASAAMALVISVLFWWGGFNGAPVVFGHAATLLIGGGLALFGIDNLGMSTISDSWAGATGGWIDLLRRRIPTEPTGSLLMPTAVLAWVSMAITSEVVLRTKRASLGLLPLGAAAYGFVLLGTGADGRVLLGLVMAALMLAYLWLAAGEGGTARTERLDRAGVRSVLLALGVGSLALIVGFGAATLLGDTNRWNPRTNLAPPVEVQSQASPLTLLKAQMTAEADRTLFTVEVEDPSALSGPLYLRTVALESYDGVLWRSHSAFPVVGSTLEANPGPWPSTTLRISTTADYSSQFLPVLGNPLSVDVDGAGYAPETDTLVLRAPASDLDFSVEVSVVPSDDGQIRSASSVGRVENEIFLDFEERQSSGGEDAGQTDGSKTIQELVDELGAPITVDFEGSTGASLLLLREQLTEGFTNSTKASSGHSIASLKQYLGLDADDANTFPARVGYAEQAASLFAVVARNNGYPTRLAVGYKVPADAAGGAIPVTETMAWAWPEVRLEGLGWVPIEATSTQTDDSIAAPEAPVVVQPTLDLDGQAEAIEQSETPPQSPIVEQDGFVWWWLFTPLVLLPVIPWLAKILRRVKRRRVTSRAYAVLGAWNEARDRLRDVGVLASSSFTAREHTGMAKRAGVVDESTALDRLADLTDVALYSPDELTDGDVETAKKIEELVRGEIRERVSMATRIKGRLGIQGLLPLRVIDETPPPVFADLATIATSTTAAPES